MRPDCERFVPGFGDANADFHVIGDHPGVHGGIQTGVPFTGIPAAEALQDALHRAGLLQSVGTRPTVERTFLSYLHMCVPDAADGNAGFADPTTAEYADMERFFDAELRAIAAHVLLPVGMRATTHVLETYTALGWKTAPEMERLHGRELHGSGWLVVPIRDPAEWTDELEHADRLVTGLRKLQSTDFRRESDLGRFLPGEDPYLVR